MSFLLHAAILICSTLSSNTIKQVCDLPGTATENITQPIVITASSNIRLYIDDTLLGTSDIIYQDIEIAGDSSFFVVVDGYFRGKLKVVNVMLGSRFSLYNDIVLGSSYFCNDVSVVFQNTERLLSYNCTFRNTLKINEVQMHYHP